MTFSRPSKTWEKGSTHAWRKVRALVLARDGYRCQLRLEGICTTIADQVHHTVAREISGDDPAHLVSACRACNLAVGNPRANDPQPRRQKWW